MGNFVLGYLRGRAEVTAAVEARCVHWAQAGEYDAEVAADIRATLSAPDAALTRVKAEERERIAQAIESEMGRPSGAYTNRPLYTGDECMGLKIAARITRGGTS